MKKSKRGRYEYEFLPSALEIEETPPSPGGKFIVWTVFFIIIIAVVWSVCSKTDKVAVARGKIIPAGKAKVIESSSQGIVEKIYVKEGDKVKKGQLLVSLDPTLNNADVEELEKKLASLMLRKILLEVLLTKSSLETLSKIYRNPKFKILNKTVIAYHLKLQETRLYQYKEKEIIQKHILIQRQTEKEISETNLRKMKKRFKVISAQEKMLRRLHRKGSVSEQKWIQKKSELDSLEHEIIAQQSKIQNAGHKIKETKETLNLIYKEWRTENLKDIVEIDNNISSIRSRLKKAMKKLQLLKLFSPVTGTVNQIEITTIGESVSPARPLITIVPYSMTKIAEVYVRNADIGFIHKNQTAEIKLDTFPFHKYGVVEGKVINISPDAIVDKKTGTLTYEVFIEPLKNKIRVGKKYVKLVPGMSLTAEIKTGSRRIIEYFLEPLMKFKDEAFKKR
ncbi:MAG: HlyD family type I secretion periplasmic adaptor subunit [Victivallales bacterium]|nr:HlyD family type I secretion periplasmic adaptor subunit [Victivallales bacterium]